LRNRNRCRADLPGMPRKRARPIALRCPPTPVARADFDDVLRLIDVAKRRAYQAVNMELVDLYWRVGEHVSNKMASAEWGDAVIEDLAATIAQRHPGIRGFTRPNLFRMRQFFEAYRGDQTVSSLLTQLPWTHHLTILSQAKRAEEREFYMRMAITERWSSRELERQCRSQRFHHVVCDPAKVSAVLRQSHPDAENIFKNSYSLEFLGLPACHSEADLHRSLLGNLGCLISELGSDFCFVGSEYPVQVGKKDFAIDMVFFHRGLCCLIAIELKVRDFHPEDLGKLSFYLEALDRSVKKPNERPSIGLLLCATKDAQVVEYALNRTLSPALVAEYQTALPPKALIRAKLHDLYAQLAHEV
jgi:predicted nuclease of restriction endonuclease-like (RecB) superfamily